MTDPTPTGVSYYISTFETVAFLDEIIITLKWSVFLFLRKLICREV